MSPTLINDDFELCQSHFPNRIRKTINQSEIEEIELTIRQYKREGSLRKNKKLLDHRIGKISGQVLHMIDDIGDSSHLGSEYFECWKSLMTIQVFHILGMINTVEYLAGQLAKKANRHYFLDILVHAQRLLYAKAYRSLSFKKAQEASQKFDKILLYFSIEKKLEKEKIELYSNFNIKQQRNVDFANRIDTILKDYREYLNSIPSFYFITNFYE